MEYINRLLLHRKSGGGSSKQKAGQRSEPTADNKGLTVGEDSFVTDKGEQNSESSYISAGSQSKSAADTDTDTTADYESAGESDTSPYGSLVAVPAPAHVPGHRDAASPNAIGADSSSAAAFDEDVRPADVTLVNAANQLSITRLADDIESILRLSTPGKAIRRHDTSGSSTLSEKSSVPPAEDIEERFGEITSDIFSLVSPGKPAHDTSEELKLELSFASTTLPNDYVVLDRTLENDATRNVDYDFVNESVGRQRPNRTVNLQEVEESASVVRVREESVELQPIETENSIVRETVDSEDVVSIVQPIEESIDVHPTEKSVGHEKDESITVQTVEESVKQDGIESIQQLPEESKIDEAIAAVDSILSVQATEECIKHDIVPSVDSVVNVQTVEESVKQDSIESDLQLLEESNIDEAIAAIDSILSVQATEECIKHDIVPIVDSVVNVQTVEESVKQDGIESDLQLLEESKIDEAIAAVDSILSVQATEECFKHDIVSSADSVVNVQTVEESVETEIFDSKHVLESVAQEIQESKTDESIGAVDSIASVQTVEECIERESVDSKDSIKSVVQLLDESKTGDSIAAVDSIVNVQTVEECIEQDSVDSKDDVKSVVRPIEESKTDESVAAVDTVVNVQTVEECIEQESANSKDVKSVVQPIEESVKYKTEETVAIVDSIVNVETLEECIKHDSVDSKDVLEYVVQPIEESKTDESIAAVDSIVNVQTVEEYVKQESVDYKDVKSLIRPIEQCKTDESIAASDSVLGVQTVEEYVKRENVDSKDVESVVHLSEEFKIDRSTVAVDSIVSVQTVEEFVKQEIVESVDVQPIEKSVVHEKDESVAVNVQGVEESVGSIDVQPIEKSFKREIESIIESVVNLRVTEDSFYRESSLTQNSCVDNKLEATDTSVVPQLETVSSEVGGRRTEEHISGGVNFVCESGATLLERCVDGDGSEGEIVDRTVGSQPAKGETELDALFKGLKIDGTAGERPLKTAGGRKPYRDMSDLMAACSQQERELRSEAGNSLFDVSIQQEAMKVALDIMNSPPCDPLQGRPKTSSSRRPDSTLFKVPQCMMRSAVSPDINRSEAGPVTADEHFREGESFQDATKFDFEFLSRVGSQQTGRCQARQSIIVSFDPLFQSATTAESQKLNAAMSDSAGSESESKISNDSVCGGATPKKVEDDCEPVQKLVSITPSKSETPSRPKSTVSSLSTPPTIRQDILSKEILKLQELMIQQEQSYQEQLTSTTEMLEKQKLRINELEAKDSRETVEEKRRAAEAKLKATETKLSKVEKELADSTLSRKQLTMIMEEYEKTISQLVTKREDERQEFEQVKETIANERDAALKHLSNMEVAFNDVHQKYEKCKGVIENMKVNETAFKESIAANEKTIKKFEADYQKLKKHASEKLESANEELASLRKAHHGEVAKLKAIAKKAEIRIKSLEDSLEQKEKEVRELTQICDELIGKVEQP